MDDGGTEFASISNDSFLGNLVHTLHIHWVEIILVLLVYFLGFGFYLWFYFRVQLMPMIDGPYYLIQVQSLLKTGTLVYGDPPLTFYLLTVTTLIYGDIMVGVKVGVAFFLCPCGDSCLFLNEARGEEYACGLPCYAFHHFFATVFAHGQ